MKIKQSSYFGPTKINASLDDRGNPEFPFTSVWVHEGVSNYKTIWGQLICYCEPVKTKKNLQQINSKTPNRSG